MKRLFVGGRGAWAAAAGVVTVGGCLPLLGLDDGYHAVGSGGGGGATSSSTGTTSSSGTGGETSSSTGTTSGGGTGGATTTSSSASGTGGGTGAVGVLGQPCPSVGALACSGNNQKLSLVCGGNLTWEKNGACKGGENCDSTPGPNQGTCAPIVDVCANAASGDIVCAGLARVKCGPDLVTTEDVETCSGACMAGQCTACVPLDKQCMGNQPQSCDANGAWQNEAACSTQMPACIKGGCGVPPSCAGLPSTCGPNGNESCCAVGAIPGGTYDRSNDAAYPATVSDFWLDRFEITVGRFREFVASYPGNKPMAGAGAHSSIAGSGWQAGWTGSLPADQAALKAVVNCNPSYQTWTDAVGGNENKPINCIDWYEAFAFCAWDGGRLPTEAEWNYAAAGGSEQRQYPWSNPPSSTMIDSSYAVYNGVALAEVGSKSAQGKGDGKWGQADLAGGVLEWNLDWYGNPYSIPQCDNCATIAQGGASSRVVRGGSWLNGASILLSSFRDSGSTYLSYSLGARCARIP